ncbi:MAG: o-succinylbenzoate synthase [Opitutales bacterium]
MELTFNYRPYRRRFLQSLRTGHGKWAVREGVLVRVSDEAGRAGLGEMAPLAVFGTETLETSVQFCREREGRINSEEIDLIPEELPCCRFACEEAYRAYAGAMEGEADSSRELPVAALLPAGGEALEVLPEVLARGFSVIKWKIGVYPHREEMECFFRLMERIPQGVNVRLDGNGALTRSAAETWITEGAKAGVEFLEQPLPPPEVDALLELARDGSLRLALDESVASLWELRRWLDRGWPGLFVIKPALTGSFGDFQSVIRQLGSPDSFVFSSVFETKVGMKAALAWAFSFSEKSFSPRALGFGTGGAFGDGLSPVLFPTIRWRDVEDWNLDAVWAEVGS